MKKKLLIWTLTICVALQAFPMSAAAAMPESATVSESEVPSEQSSVPEGSGISEPESGDTAETDPLSDKQESSEPEAAPVPETPEQENTDEEIQDPLLPEAQTDPEETTETQTETEVTEETADITVSGNDPSSLSAAQEPLIFVTVGNTGVIQTGSLDTFSSSDYGIMSVSTDYGDAISYVAEQMQNRAFQIDLEEYQIPMDQMDAFHAAIFNEHPELYFVNSLTISYGYDPQTNILVHMKVPYLDGYDNTAFDAAVAQALSLLDPSMDDAQKALVLHDYLATQCEYDKANYLQGTIPADSYNAYGPLVLHTAVCQGYALAYKYLLNLAGIDCLIVTSKAMNHAWNLVELDGEYYQTDVTWDDPTWDRLGCCMHSNFLVSDARLEELKHYDWTIQRNAKEVNLTATDTRYESSDWYESNAQVLLRNGYVWYLLPLKSLGNHSYQPGAIYRKDLASGRTECIYTFKDRWMVWDSSSFWTSTYSGLEWIDGRLFFNTPTEICSIAPDGTDLRQECQPDTSAGYLYGIARQEEHLKYCIRTDANLNGAEDVYIADLSEDIQTPIYYISLSPSEITLRTEESAVLNVTVYPESADTKTLFWQSSAPEVAEVSNGTVHTLSVGEAEITVTAPSGVSASCSITVLPPAHTVIFYDRDGNVLKELTEVDEGTDLTALAPDPPEAADGYSFTGWDQPLDNILSDLDVYPLYEPILYSITYELNGGTQNENNPDSYTVESGTIVLQAPVRDNCFFDGWYTDRDFTSPIEQIESGSFGDLTLYAAWREPVPAPAADPSSGPVLKGTAITLSCEMQDAEIYYTTDGTTPTRDSFLYTQPFTPVSDCTIQAFAVREGYPDSTVSVFEYTIQLPVYKVSFFDRNGKILTTLSAEEGANLTALAPEPPEAADGYSFTGWDQPLDEILSDLDVYPMYEPILYSITYELNGGTQNGQNPDTYTVESDPILLQAPERENYFFSGWYKDEALTQPIVRIETGSFGNLTLYAAWSQRLPDDFAIGAIPQLDQTLSGIPVSLPVGWEWVAPETKLASFTGIHSKLFSVVRRDPDTHEEIYDTVKVVFLTVEDLEIRRQDGSLLSSDDALPELLPGESEDFLCSYHWSDDALYAQREASSIRISASAQPSNVLLASASLQGDDAFCLTAKKAGTAAVTVTVTGDLPSSPSQKTVSIPLLQKKISFRIPNPQTDEKAEVSIRLLDENGQALTPNQDGQYELASGAVCYVQDDTPKKADGKSYSIQYKVSDTALLKLSAVASDKTRKKLTAAKPGIAVLTAQANDKRKSGVSLTIRVISTDISISSSSADICLLSENPAATLTVYNGYGAGLTDAKLTATDGSPATGFLLQDFSPDGAIQIGLEKGNTKGGKLLLTVTTDDGLQNPWSTTEKAFPITIRVNSKKPAVTVKQSKKVNTFLEEEDAWGLLSVGAAGEVIESVRIKETDPKAFGYEYDEVSGALKVRPGGDISKKTGTLSIKLAGYADPLEKTFTVSTESVSHKLSAASAVFYPGDSRDIRIQMLEKSTGRAVDLTGASVTAALPRTGEALPSGQYDFAVTEDGTAIRITALADPASLPASTKLKLTVSNPDAWHESRTFDFTVKTADLSKAALQLGSKTLTLYAYIGQDGASTVSTPLTLTGGYSPVDILEQTAISGANSASLSALGKTLSVEYEKENSRIVVRTIGEKVPAGSYKFNLTLHDPSVAKEWKTALTVKVVSVDANSSNQKNRPGVKITASGSIDLLNRANTYVTLTPKFTNVAADAVIAKENIRLTGPDAHLFEIAWQKGNAVAIRLKPEAVAVTKYAYQVKAVYTLTSCNVPLQVTSNAVNIKLKQGKPQISAKGGTVFSNTKTEETKLTFLALNSAKKELVIEKVELLNDTGEFSYDLETGTLTHTPAGKTASNKSYKLKFQIILKDAADNEKPISVTYTVKLLKF